MLIERNILTKIHFFFFHEKIIKSRIKKWTVMAQALQGKKKKVPAAI